MAVVKIGLPVGDDGSYLPGEMKIVAIRNCSLVEEGDGYAVMGSVNGDARRIAELEAALVALIADGARLT